MRGAWSTAGKRARAVARAQARRVSRLEAPTGCDGDAGPGLGGGGARCPEGPRPRTPPGEENQTLVTPSDSGWPAPPRGDAARRRGLGEEGERVSVPGGLGTQPREAEAPPPAPVPPPRLRSPRPRPCSTSSSRAPPPRQRLPPRTAIGCFNRGRSLPAEVLGSGGGLPLRSS